MAAALACALLVAGWLLIARDQVAPTQRHATASPRDTAHVDEEEAASASARVTVAPEPEPDEPPAATEDGPEASDGIVATRGTLTPTQKAMATEVCDRFVTGALARYRGLPTGTQQELLASLHAALEGALYQAALEQIRDDEVQTFRQGRDQQSYWHAVRSLPRHWQSVRIRNAARTDDGTMIDLLVPIDPATHPAVQSVLAEIETVHEQMTAAGRTSGR